MKKIVLLTAMVVLLTGCEMDTTDGGNSTVDLDMNDRASHAENIQDIAAALENLSEDEKSEILEILQEDENASTQEIGFDGEASEVFVNDSPQLATSEDNAHADPEPTGTEPAEFEPTETEPTASPNDDLTDNSIGEFDSLNLSISKGSLYVRTGSEFDVTEKGGGKATYSVSGGTLYFENDSSREFVLTLPYDSFNDITLNANDGHIYLESSLSAKTLNLTIRKGEMSIADITVSESSSIDAKEGSGTLKGDFGQTLTASIENGKLAFKLAHEQDSYNYSINVYQGNVNIGSSNYHNRSDSWTIDNGAENQVSLNANRGDISVQF